jgi:hypothetical protein
MQYSDARFAWGHDSRPYPQLDAFPLWLFVVSDALSMI